MTIVSHDEHLAEERREIVGRLLDAALPFPSVATVEEIIEIEGQRTVHVVESGWSMMSLDDLRKLAAKLVPVPVDPDNERYKHLGPGCD